MKLSQLLACIYLETVILAYDHVVGRGTGKTNRLAKDKSICACHRSGTQGETPPGSLCPWPHRYKPIFHDAQSGIQDRSSGKPWQQTTVNAGKALGGSTIISSMIFPRAVKEQYDAWGELNNDSAWTWDALLPFFINSEHFNPPNEFQASNGGARFIPDVHGSSGRVKVGFPNFFFRQSTLWREASMSLGFAASPDLADGNPHAVGVAANSLDPANNTRCSAACAYYTPFANEPNFTVLTNATVARIIWAKTTTQSPIHAVAVEFMANGQTLTVPVSREVIVAAGTIGSPKVVELSGVGNSTILSRAGIQVTLEHLTVGENLADHVHSWANAFTTLSLTKDVLSLNNTFAAEQLA